jgi:hypothetical protein
MSIARAAFSAEAIEIENKSFPFSESMAII